jgi:two-component system, NarL family, response regulator NreC
MTMNTLRLLLADDHLLVRQGLRRILEARDGWQVVAEAGDGREAVGLALEERPDVSILDISMPQLDGIEAARQIKRRWETARILMLSMYQDEAYVTRSLQAGVRGYVLKSAADRDLVAAVEALASGKAYFSPAVAEVMRDQYVQSLAQHGKTDRYDALSEREREVFQLIVEGHSNKEIAEILGVSVATVESHRAHVMEKLDLHSAVDVVRYAARRGLVR